MDNTELKNINLHPILFESKSTLQKQTQLNSYPSKDRQFRNEFVDRRLPSVAALEEYNSERSSLIDNVSSKQGNLYYEKKASPKCNKSYFKESLKGIHGGNLFTKMFYSQKNINNIQNVIIYNVHKHTGDIISRQHDNELLIVMRSSYLQHSVNPIVNDLKDPNQRTAMQNEINRLNAIVLDYIVPDIVSQILQYKRYLVDITQNHVPIPREINPSMKGTKEFRDLKELMSLN